MKEYPSIQNLARRSVSRLFDSIEDGDLAKDEPLPLLTDELGWLGRLRWKVNLFIARAKKKYKGGSFIAFLFSLFSYVSMRIKVIFVLLAVVTEVFGGYTDFIRRIFVKNLFWGRGGVFRFAIQFLFLIVIIFVFAGYAYRQGSPLTVASKSVYGSEKSDEIGRQDLLVQEGSSSTLSPKERGRMQFLNYTVKLGDTLSKIGQAQVPKISAETILWANPFIKNGVIRPGDVLNIPPDDGVVVVAKKGDTVYSLAKKYDISPQNIADKNLYEYPYELNVGEKVFLPGAVPIVAPKPVAPKVVYSGVFSQKPTFSSGSTAVSGVSRFLNWPIAGNQGKVSQCYSGYNGSIHNGLDIADNGFSKIVAAAPGKVMFAGCQSGNCPPRGIGSWGGTGLAWTVIISHGNGYSTIYGHLDDIYIGSGSTVSAGQVIGRMGRSGYATGTHLHFMVIKGGWDSWNDTNPAYFFKTSAMASHKSYCW